MKKVYLMIILTLGLIVTSGCAKLNNTNTPGKDDKTNNSKPLTKVVIDAGKKEVTDNNAKSANLEIADNAFFIKSNVSQVNFKGTFLFTDVIEKQVILHFSEVANLKYGKLYQLKLDAIKDVPNDRLRLAYLYVQKNKIYKIEPTSINELKTSEEIPIDSVIVCQDKEMKDTLNDNELGWHHYIEVNGDTREYHSYNNQVSTGYYESFSWKKGKGLINYRSGYGAERDSIELQLK